MFTHYGCVTTRFFPKNSHGKLSAADLEPTTLKYLRPYVDKLLLPRGIRAMNEWTAKMERGQGNDQHTQAVGSYFTCQPLTPNSNDPFDISNSATRFNAKPIGPSLDHVIAQQLSPNGTPLLINVRGGSDIPASAISYSAAETLFRGMSGVEAFAALTQLFGGGPMSTDTYQAMRGKSILDLVRSDLETLERAQMSQADRRKLAAWKELVNETGKAMTTSKARFEELAGTLSVNDESFSKLAVKNGNDDRVTRKLAEGFDGADLHSNLAVLAAASNANSVVFLKYPGNHTFSGLGINMDSDNLSGRLSNAGMVGTCVQDAIKMLVTLDEYYASKFAHLVGKLDDIQEGDGTLLDNTATIWFQEFSDGAAGNLNNLPIVQAGSCGGYFKTGWAVNVEDGSSNLTAGRSEDCCNAATGNQINAVDQSTGTDPRIANAPINKYYCGLMNALGVKAGRDGFPAKGGTAEVSRFGRYDRTQDFIGGDVNPPHISDPGEFAALRANS